MAYGEVVRVSPSKEKRKQLFDTSIRFLIIDESEREKLISYAFYKQRQEIRSLAMAKDKNRNNIRWKVGKRENVYGCLFERKL